IDWTAYDRAAARRGQMPPASLGPLNRHGRLLSSPAWKFIGPNNLRVPYQIFYGIGPLSGRVNAAAFAPGNPGTYYVGAASGGVWKTTDRGVTWTPLSNDWPFLHVSSIAIDPTDSNIVYVGTGDFDGDTGHSFGIMKS